MTPAAEPSPPASGPLRSPETDGDGAAPNPARLGSPSGSVRPLSIEEGLDTNRERRVPIPVRLVVALGGLIAIGTALLLLPGMVNQRITFMDALFTSTSAAAVTGLSVVTTSTTFTRLGQWVILLLMQLGGLGFLVVVVLTIRLLGRRVSFLDRLAVSSSLGLASSRAVLEILARTLALMLAIEGIGAAILAAHWALRGIVPLREAPFYGLFHAVAAFCNAGFDLFSGSPVYPQGLPADPITLVTMGCLVFVGGLGIPVYMELLYARRQHPVPAGSASRGIRGHLRPAACDGA